MRRIAAHSRVGPRLACWQPSLAVADFSVLKRRLFRREVETSTRDACATQMGRTRFHPHLSLEERAAVVSLKIDETGLIPPALHES